MKTIAKGFLFMSLLMAVNFSMAQSDDAAAKEKRDKKEKKALLNDIKEKAPKQARREARKFLKQKYEIPAGALPLDKQLEMAWMKQYEVDENNYPKFIIGNANAIGNNYSAAKNQAINLAKVELAGLISTQVAALAENSVANQDLSKQEAASVVKTIEASKNIIAQDLGRVLNILEIYKTLENKNVEVQVRLAYSADMAAETTRKKIVQKLEDETKIAHEKLEKMMNMPEAKNFKKNSNVPESDQ